MAADITLAKLIRTRAAEVIAGAKAYDVPSLCSRLGLAPGEVDEAMRSKFKYAHSRLMNVPAAKLLPIARAVLEEDRDFALSELVAKAEERGSPEVSALTRRRILGLFEGEALCTEFDEIAFLEQIWPLASMPSVYENGWGEPGSLRDDIIQHTVRNYDWTNRELLEHLGLLHCSKALLFRFLEAAVHPTTVSDEMQQRRVERINNYLRHDGYRLQRAGRLSGSVVFKVDAASGTPADEAISGTLARFEPEQVHGRWETALERRGSDPAGAITLARTLLEDVCRWLLDNLEVSASDQDDLPQLYRKLSKALQLAPDDHSEQVFKQILGSCQSVVESLGALRNKLGDAHSSGPRKSRPAPRHAELAVNLAGSMATFLVSTWEARQCAKPKTCE